VRRFISRIYPLLKQLLAIYQITLSRQKIYVWFFINHSVEQSIPSSCKFLCPLFGCGDSCLAWSITSLRRRQNHLLTSENGSSLGEVMGFLGFVEHYRFLNLVRLSQILYSFINFFLVRQQYGSCSSSFGNLFF
jgi:hypothetical protein